jgi:hypothetical protein
MRRIAALWRIEMSKFNLGPTNNQRTALGEKSSDFPAVLSRGVEAATRPQLTPVANAYGAHVFAAQNCFEIDELNFEFVGAKSSMNAFMVRLGRVYHSRDIRSLCIS